MTTSVISARPSLKATCRLGEDQASLDALTAATVRLQSDGDADVAAGAYTRPLLSST
jgi:hypothetical protein